MPTITRTILDILSQKTARQLDGSEAVVRLLAELRKQVAAELVAMPAESYAALNLRATMRSIEGHLSTWQSAAGREVTTALSDVWNQGTSFVPTVAGLAGVYSGIGHISTNLLDTLTEFTTSKLGNVATDLQSRINAEIHLGILGQKTPGQIADAILGAGLEAHQDSFMTARQRATTIVQTEMGRAFSMATNLGIEKAQEVLPEMEKLWLHAGRPKQARLTHVIAHGQHVPANEKFLIGSIAMKYPRDPAGGAANSVHCGCDMVPYMPDWYTPDEFIADWEKQQDKVNNRKKEATHG
jgi:hypothetical protein